MTLPDRLHLGCGEDYRPGWHNVDVAESVRTDQHLDVTDTPWPFPSDHFTEIRGEHIFEHLPNQTDVLRECRRVLTADGELTVIVPVGLNAITDPDHATVWTWDTPRYYCGARHWDVDTGLTVVDRDVRLWSTLPGLLGAVHRLSLKARFRYYDAGVWCFTEPYSSGEFTVVFEA